MRRTSAAPRLRYYISGNGIELIGWPPSLGDLVLMQSANYDAIVVGSGISGGWAAKELTENGLKVLLLERGRNVEHITGYVDALKAPWEFPHRNRMTTAL